MSVETIRKDLQDLATAERAEKSKRYFRTGPGEYGEGDQFIGVSAPDLRRLTRIHRECSVGDVVKLLASPIHEERHLAAMLLTEKYRRARADEKMKIFEFYVSHLDRINNWDIVDCSAPKLVGIHLLTNTRERKRLDRWARAKSLWTRRIAIVATQTLIKNDEFDDTLRIATVLLRDKEDLIHKAVGWMLREVGKRDLAVEEGFLKRHYGEMPRTMLRYAIEKLSPEHRKAYLDGRI